MSSETLDGSSIHQELAAVGPVPGLLLIFAQGVPRLATLALTKGRIELGRDFLAEAYDVQDGRISRRHAEVSFDNRTWTVKDLGSRNGTAVDGVQLTASFVGEPRVIRLGETLFLPVKDVQPFITSQPSSTADMAIGPTLRRAWTEIARHAAAGSVLHMTGETGSGKELAARHFHASSARKSGPFVAVNCAAVPSQIAERLFFGAKRGAYSGAEADAEGYIQAAHGGTLFLDELGELDQSVQAKLLRVLETHEVLPLGAARPRTVDFGLVSATHADLHALVSAGKFRADLYFRLGRPSVRLPPLRDRREDIPWLIAHALASAGKLKAHVSLVEAALLRAWPGNVRELLTDVKVAADAAAAAQADAVRARDLPLGPDSFASDDSGELRDDSSSSVSEGAARDVSREQIEAALRTERGNISGAARALGLHRTQLRRLLTRYGIDARTFGPQS